jgi:hypothetical protein
MTSAAILDKIQEQVYKCWYRNYSYRFR